MYLNFYKAVLLLFAISLNPVHGANQNQLVKAVTQEDIQQKIQAVKEKQNLAEELKKRIFADYDESLDNLKEAQAQENQGEEYKKSMTALPLESKQLMRQMADAENSLKNRKQEKFILFPTDELEQRLIIEKSALSDLDAEIARLEAQVGEQLNRPPLIREKASDIKNKLAAALQEQQGLTARSFDNIAEKEARQIRLETRIRLLNSSLKTLELENISDPLRLQASKDRIRLLSLQREQRSMLIADLDNFLLDRRQQEIDKEQVELQQAEKAAEGKHPLIQEAAKENMRYNRSLQEINKNMEQFLAQKNDLEQRYKQLEKDFQSAEQKINLAGLSPALGNLLREQRRNLPQRKQYSNLNDNIQNEIANASLETFKLEEAKKNLSDVGQALLSRMDQHLSADTGDSDKLRIRTELRMLLNDQKDLVARLGVVYGEYSRVLGDVDFNLQQMLGSAEKFSAYLDQRLLWVPSAPVIDKYYFKDIAKSLIWLVSPANWRQVLADLWLGINLYPLLVLLGMAIIALQWRYKDVAKNHLQMLLSRQKDNSQHIYSFGQTLQALTSLLLLSLYGPLLMIWLGGILKLSGHADIFSHSFASGLFKAAVSLGVIQFFFRLFKPQGVAEVFFEWRQNMTFLLFRQFKWARFVLVPAVFLTGIAGGGDQYSENSLALGRMALIIMMLAISYLFHRLAHPRTGLGENYYRQSQGWISSLRYLWYVLPLLLPLAIICFAVAGYYQSALELQEKLIVTLRLIFITALFHELAQSWLAVSKQKLALQNARQKRKRKQEEQINPSAPESGIIVAEELPDISKVHQQSDKLLTTVTAVIGLVGCWMIWSDIITAFSVLDRFVLWQHATLLDGKETLQPITLTNLLISLAYTALSFVFVSNFPALVDLLAAGKFEITPGSRYALIQLARYVLIVIAFLAIANELGGDWSQVQWLVAALSVGLGFGLQEIFANMVSGIILLFERPIRVGDTVTVGEVTGRVSRIQMRATHIVDWDRKELVVPNKIFITNQLINWTLSDTVTRIVLPIGVGYGSEIETVERVLMEAIKKTELILAEPAPNVIFNGFGENALNFDIHVFVHELKERIGVKHSLNKNIYEALQANHIEIPYPHRDVHIRWEPDEAPPTGQFGPLIPGLK